MQMAASRALASGRNAAASSSSTLLRFSRSYAVKSSSVAASPSSPPSVDNLDAGTPKSLPSAAPPGTVLAGLSILKDRADPIALEDSQYPPWLFKLLDDPSIAASSSLSTIAMASMTKGEARVAAKRQMKTLRAERLAKEKAEAKAAEKARLRNQTDSKSKGVSPETFTADAVSQSEAEEAVRSGAYIAEKAQHKAIRKANRDAIKARNFVSAA